MIQNSNIDLSKRVKELIQNIDVNEVGICIEENEWRVILINMYTDILIELEEITNNH